MAQTDSSSEKTFFKGSYYGWWIVLGGFLMMCTCYAAYANCLPVFQAHIVAAFNETVEGGFTVGNYTTITGLAGMVGVIFTLFIGVLIDKVPARILCSTLVILGSIMLFGYGLATQPWHLAILSGLSGILVTIGLRLAISVVISNWFNLKRGLATSLALCGSGFGGAILATVVSYIIEGVGYRTAFFVLGVIVLVIALPIPLIFYRTRPSDIGLLPYGAELSKEELKEAEGGEKKTAEPNINVAVGFKECKKSLAFWLLVIGFLLIGTINGGVTQEMTVNNTTVGGHSTVIAGYFQSLYLIVVVVGKVGLGEIFDRFGCAKASIVAAVCCALACVFLCFPSTYWGPIGAAIFFGVGTCIATLGPSVMITRTFGRLDSGTLVGVAGFATGLGGVIGAIAAGQVFDATGNFNACWIAFVVCAILLAVCLVASVKGGHKKVAKLVEKGAPLIDESGKVIEGSNSQTAYRVVDGGKSVEEI